MATLTLNIKLLTRPIWIPQYNECIYQTIVNGIWYRLEFYDDEVLRYITQHHLQVGSRYHVEGSIIDIRIGFGVSNNAHVVVVDVTDIYELYDNNSEEALQNEILDPYYTTSDM